MTEADYQTFLAQFIPVYAAEKVLAGNWTKAESLEHSQQEMEKLLPQGIQTPGQFVYKLVNEGAEAVGLLWYGSPDNRPGEAYIFQFEIYEPFRRRGYASQALSALGVQAKAQGFKRLALHVFGFNTAAREMYRKSGFAETNVNMARDI